MKVKILVPGRYMVQNLKVISCEKNDILETKAWYGESLIKSKLAKPVSAIEELSFNVEETEPSGEELVNVMIEERLGKVTEEKETNTQILPTLKVPQAIKNALIAANLTTIKAIKKAEKDGNLIHLDGIGVKGYRLIKEALYPKPTE